MAEELKSKEKETTNAKKKIATGSTHKVVQSRKSSIAAKNTAKKASDKEKKSSTTSKSTKKESGAKKSTAKSASKKSDNETVKKVLEENEKPKRTRKTKVADEVVEEAKPKKTTKAKKEEKLEDKPKRARKTKEAEEEKKTEQAQKYIKPEEEKAQKVLEEIINNLPEGESKRVIKEQARKYLPNYNNLEKKEIEEEKVVKASSRTRGKHASSKESRIFAKNSEEEEEKEEIQKEDLQIEKKNEVALKEAVAKEMKANKKMPATEQNKINGRIFQNICIAVAIMFYLNFVILGFVNIENEVFITDLKVFSVAILILSFGTLEYAYKKDSGRHAIHGIELLILAFLTMLLIYINLMWQERFIFIVSFSIYAFAIYYVAKSIIIYQKMKKVYFVDRMKEMIKK